jgi:HlyD family secretion protein
MNGKRWRLVGGAVLAAAVLVAFATRGGSVPVRAEKATRENIVNTISTNGKIEPVDNFEAHAPAATTVKRLFVREGDRVKAGQKILQLDDANARADAARALARLKAAEADMAALKTGGTHEEVLNREADLVKARAERDSAQRNLDAVKQLEQRGSASPAELQEAENRYKKAQADVTALEQKQSSRYSRPEVAKVQAEAGEARAAYEAAQSLLRNANVTAPHDGLVYSLPVKQGQYVNAGDLLAQIGDLKRIQVRAFVDEPEIGKLATGQPVNITWDALPGRMWTGTLTRVPSTVTQHGTRTVGEILVEVENSDLKLLPNINVSVVVTTAKHDNALTVSREAIHQDGGKRYVFEIVKGELKRRDVETAVSSLTRIEVARGIGDGATVALGASTGQALKDGMEVRVIER